MKDQITKPAGMVRSIGTVGGPNLTLVIIAVVIVFLGVGAGYLLSGMTSGGGLDGPQVAPGGKAEKNEAGFSEDKTAKTDKATGKLEKDGVEGEGTHHLVRDGGPSQNVYLTSSVVDLDDFVGRKVDVWGETNKGQKAGWLMDVVRLKVVE